MDVKTAKILSRYRSGLVTAPEAANSLLYDLVLEPEIDAGLVATVGELPDEIRREFRQLLQSIEEADYRWTPFLLNFRPGSSDLDRYSTKLRRINALLG